MCTFTLFSVFLIFSTGSNVTSFFLPDFPTRGRRATIARFTGRVARRALAAAEAARAAARRQAAAHRQARGPPGHAERLR